MVSDVFVGESLIRDGDEIATSTRGGRSIRNMQKLVTKFPLFVASLFWVSASLSAHHGRNNAYDMSQMWTTWATVEEFSFINPHPAMKFTRTDKDGKVEHWGGDVFSNPSRLARIGWTRARSLEALKPGTRVKLYLATARGGGFSAYVGFIESDKGEGLLSEEEPPRSALDLDGVPGGYQPKLQGQR